MLPTQAYKIINIAEVDPVGNPPTGFMYLFPRAGKWWSRNSSGQEEMFGSIDFDEVVSIPSWDIDTTYTLDSGGVTVIHNEKLWNLSAAESLGEEPGVSADWVESSISALSHVQGTDLKFGRHPTLLDGGGTQTFDLTNSNNIDRNFFFLETGIGDPDATYTLRTVNGGLRKQGEFLVVCQLGHTFNITFQDNADQKIGIDNLVLTGGDWAKFEGDVNGKTTLIASNKKQGGGVGESPFDQGLNKADDVEFNSVKIPPIKATSTETDVAGIDDTGTLVQLKRKNIKDVVLTEFVMYDETLEANVLYQSVNGVLVGTEI